FDVPVDDAFGVGGVERVGNLNRQGQQSVCLQRSARSPMLQSHPVQELHGDERFAVLVVNFVDRADIRVVESRSSLGFALKAAESLRVFGHLVGQELEGDKPAAIGVL